MNDTRTAPRPLGDARAHLTLVRCMARAVGADIEAAAENGRLRQDEWAEAVSRCRGCADAAGCRAWLLEVEWGGQAAPYGCRNAALMQRLAED